MKKTKERTFLKFASLLLNIVDKMEVGYSYHSDMTSTIGRVREVSPSLSIAHPISAPYQRTGPYQRTALPLSCLTLPRGWRAVEDRSWLHSPIPISLPASFACKQLSVTLEEPGHERDKRDPETKLKFGVDNILSSEFGLRRKKRFPTEKCWWQAPSTTVMTSRGLGFSSSLHIPTESSYTYPSIITPAHMDTPTAAVLPHYPLEKCGYGYLSSPYGHLKQTDLLGSQDMAYKGAPRRKKTWSRAVFTSLQRRGLEKRFEVQKYVNKPDRKQLASALGLTDSQVKVWFQNRRMKWRHSQRIKKQQEKAFPNSPHPELPE